MIITEKQKVVFIGTMTTDEQREELKQRGFVHVTGLRYYPSSISGNTESHRIGEELRSNEHGCTAANNGLTVAVTIGGEIWLAAGHTSVPNEVCLGKSGAFVPLSNGETISHHDLLMRMQDPYYDLDMSEATEVAS
ncbi:hypothetical protein K8R42_03720 [bacterium]|nr:hypothetical protein [bacterium]